MNARTPPAPSRAARARAAEGPLDEAHEAGPSLSPSSTDAYLNRELTWLSFNDRVLHEAEDPRSPLLERLKFLAIANSNLDEFVMKRIGGLKQQVGAGIRELTVDGRSPREQIDACHAVIRAFQPRNLAILQKLLKALGEEQIHLLRCHELDPRTRRALRERYLRNVFPLVTPQAMDPAHPFPFVSNLSLNLLVTLHYKDDTPSLARVKVPVGAGTPRFLEVGPEGSFVALEDVIADNLDLLFPGMEVVSCELFRVTRNANTERDEDEADDLLAMIETELRERKFAPIVRLEVAAGMASQRRGMLAAEFGLDEKADVFEIDGMLGPRDLMEIACLDRPTLKYPAHHPVDHPVLLRAENIFHAIRETGSLLLHHPYQSFATSVERFLREASQDPKVRAIKMTLYRTSDRAIGHLIEAARNGKQVAVVMELKARFDEQANIQWASRLEEVGVHVTYGVVGVKTHCKVILVIRQDYDGLRRYAHVGTGNYHAGTARIYEDLGLLTCDDEIGSDLTELFNYLTTGYKPRRRYRKLLPAPSLLKRSLLEKIEGEIELHSEEQPGCIQMKMNALEDVDVTRALYRASRAGVSVDLIVRDTCRLRPGLPGLSENIRVISILGRFLEHGRLFCFGAGGEAEYYIGSADCMKRNLESRVEILVPIEDPALRKELRTLLDTQLGDMRSAWEMGPDGRYTQRQAGTGKKARGSQELLIEQAEKHHRQATRLRKRKPRGIARRSGR